MEHDRSEPRQSSSPLTIPLPPTANSWQRTRLTQLMAGLAAILPMTALTIWLQSVRQTGMTLGMMFYGPMVGGGLMILWLLFLHIILCGDRLGNIGFFARKLWLDILLGILLSIGCLIFHFAFQNTAARLFPQTPPPPEIIELLSEVAHNPWLLAFWLGPVVWIGVAAFEELLRVVVLRRLWLVWTQSPGKWLVLLIAAVLFGLVHIYQGPAAVCSISIISLAMGYFYMRTGRIRALIVAHALYDSIQIIFVVIAIRYGLP